jgi:hypothetical protein
MRIALATDPGTPGWPNEDFAAAAPGAAVLLDGCTTTPYGASATRWPGRSPRSGPATRTCATWPTRAPRRPP